MLDRTIAPSYKEIDNIDIPKAENKVLNNGIPFHIIQSGTEPVIRLELVFKAGHWYEPANAVSFFTTKLLSAGTSKYTAKEIEAKIALYGAFLEIVTGYDRSTIVLYCLSKHLNSLAPLLVEMVKDSIFPVEEIENLKKITTQNYQVNLKKTSFIASSNFREELFGKTHPYSRTINEEAVNRITREDLINYHNQKFNTGNFDIILSGNGTEDFYRIINETIGKINWTQQGSVDPAYTINNLEKNSILITKEDSVQSSIRLGRILFPINHPDYFKVNLLIEILGGYFGSRLMKNIREEKGYTYGINAAFHSLKNAGYLVIGTDVNKENTASTIEEIWKEIDILKNEPISSEELTTVRNYLLGAFVSSLSTPFGLADKFKTLYYHNLDYTFYDSYTKSLRSITPKDLMEAAQKYLVQDSFLEVIAGGK